jgi:uncharacterized protein (DUF488 family)
MSRIVYTIGHSNHAAERFTALLAMHRIATVCDVRSNPYSRFNPQFNREGLKQVLAGSGVGYVFLGQELGARSDDLSCYEHGKVQYDRLARTGLFQKGLDRVEEAARANRLALMCAEKDPLDCNRTILVAPHVQARGFTVEHILDDGTLENHADTTARLLRLLNLPEQDLFRSHEEILEDAYRIRGARIAYEKEPASGHPAKVTTLKPTRLHAG